MKTLKTPLRVYISSFIALYIASLVVDGFGVVQTLYVLAMGALLLSVSDLVLKPTLNMIALPVNIVTLGAFSIVISAALLYLVIILVDGILIGPGNLDKTLNNMYIPIQLGITTIGKYMNLLVTVIVIGIVKFILKVLLF